MKIEAIHASGRFDATIPQARALIKATRKQASVITRTELTNPKFGVVLHENEDWGVYHPIHSDFGLTNCAVEWNEGVWELERQDMFVTSPRRVKTSKGFLLPPGIEVVVRLRHKTTGRPARVGAMHMMLHNTKEREDIWYEQAAALNRKWRGAMLNDHTLIMLDGVDVNWTQRLEMNRRRVQQHMLSRIPRMKNAWTQTPIPNVGTHGKAILDSVFSTARFVDVEIMKQFAGFDHRPVKVTLAA